ncbi:hypothetical protein L208DRAFT_1398317 [Tricholoma matsutake]|nr:hypothetical protein L208DRAFT_1398317 [Tricholoma matsutake 945]
MCRFPVQVFCLRRCFDLRLFCEPEPEKPGPSRPVPRLHSQASLLTTLYSVSTEANSKKRTKNQKELIDPFPAD